MKCDLIQSHQIDCKAYRLFYWNNLRTRSYNWISLWNPLPTAPSESECCQEEPSTWVLDAWLCMNKDFAYSLFSVLLTVLSNNSAVWQKQSISKSETMIKTYSVLIIQHPVVFSFSISSTSLNVTFHHEVILISSVAKIEAKVSCAMGVIAWEGWKMNVSEENQQMQVTETKGNHFSIRYYGENGL